MALLAEIEQRFHDFSDLDSRFHRLINAAAPNRFIDGFYDIITLIFHYHYQWNKQDERQRNEVAIREHLAYIDALHSRDAASVERACRAHLTSARSDADPLDLGTGALGEPAGPRRQYRGRAARYSIHHAAALEAHVRAHLDELAEGPARTDRTMGSIFALRRRRGLASRLGWRPRPDPLLQFGALPPAESRRHRALPQPAHALHEGDHTLSPGHRCS